MDWHQGHASQSTRLRTTRCESAPAAPDGADDDDYQSQCPCLVLLSQEFGDRVYPLKDGVTTIGRRFASDVAIPDLRVSKDHAHVYRVAGTWYVSDLGSSNGTCVNRERIEGERPLADGDRVEVAGIVQLFFTRQRLASRDRPGSRGRTPDPTLTTASFAIQRAPLELVSPSGSGKIPAVRRTLHGAKSRGKGRDRTDALEADDLNAVLLLGEALEGCTSEKELLELALDVALGLVPEADRAFALLVHGSADSPRFELASARARHRLAEGTRVSQRVLLEVFDCRAAIATVGRTVQPADAAAEEAAGREAVSRAAIAAPIPYRGDTLGVLYLDCPAKVGEQVFARRDLVALSAAAVQVGLGLRRHRFHNQLESRADDRLSHLERVTRDRGLLASIAGHDVVTSLDGVRAHLDLLGRRARDEAAPAWVAEELAVCAAAAARLERAVDGLLRETPVDRGRLRLAKRPTDIEALLRELAVAYERWAEAAGRRFDTVILPPLPSIPVDRARLEQVLNGLIRGAIERTPAGGIVALGARGLGDRVEIGVADEGQGFDLAETSRLAAEFREGGPPETTGPRSYELSLAIVDLVVAEHDGTLQVRPREAGGSCVTFTLVA